MSQTIKLDAGKRNFCRAYLERPDAEYAARESGVKDGWKTLESEEVQRCLERARQSAWESIRLEDVVRRLCQIAFSRPNDAVALACGTTCKSVAENCCAAEGRRPALRPGIFVRRWRRAPAPWALTGAPQPGEIF